MEPIAIVVLLVASTALASAGAGGFLSLVLHLMRRNTSRVAGATQAVPSPAYPGDNIRQAA